MRNKIRVVRRQVPNRRTSRTPARWITRKRHSHPVSPKQGEVVRTNSSQSIINTQTHKVIEPYQKTYGAITSGKLSVSPSNEQENQPLLKDTN